MNSLEKTSHYTRGYTVLAESAGKGLTPRGLISTMVLFSYVSMALYSQLLEIKYVTNLQ